MKTPLLLHRLRPLRSITLVSLLLPFALLAQNPRGALRGTVQDASGGRISSAKIIVQAQESTLRREAACNDRGEFRIDDLVPGNYRVTVSAAGFAEAASEVHVNVSYVQEMTVTLRPQAVQQTVNVEGQASSITTQPMDTSSAVQQAIITSHDLDTIPLPARSFANIAYMAPGTEPVEPSD